MHQIRGFSNHGTEYDKALWCESVRSLEGEPQILAFLRRQGARLSFIATQVGQG